LYNKSRDGQRGRVLCGNWQEEQKLHEDQTEGVAEPLGASTVWSKDLMQSRKGKNALQSSSFLTKDPVHVVPDRDHYKTETKTNFTAPPLRQQPATGVRRRLLEAQIIAEAEATVPTYEQRAAAAFRIPGSAPPEYVRSQTKAILRGMNNSSPGLSGSIGGTAVESEHSTTSGWQTEYYGGVCAVGPIDSEDCGTGIKQGQTHAFDYHKEDPITVYTSDGSYGRFQGTTAKTGANPHAKSANFSTPVTHFIKQAQPQF